MKKLKISKEHNLKQNLVFSKVRKSILLVKTWNILDWSVRLRKANQDLRRTIWRRSVLLAIKVIYRTRSSSAIGRGGIRVWQAYRIIWQSRCSSRIRLSTASIQESKTQAINKQQLKNHSLYPLSRYLRRKTTRVHMNTLKEKNKWKVKSHSMCRSQGTFQRNHTRHR